MIKFSKKGENMKCTNCGMNNEEEAKFCAKCGTELKNNKTSRKNGKKNDRKIFS